MKLGIDDFIAEGNRLRRPCILLRDAGNTPAVAFWYEQDGMDLSEELAETKELLWITVDTQAIPNCPPTPDRFLSVFASHNDKDGHVDFSSARPQIWRDRQIIELYPHEVSPLPPLYALFAEDTPFSRRWHTENELPLLESENEKSGQLWRYGGQTVKDYEELWQKESLLFASFFSPDIYAVLGGWRNPGPEANWFDYINRVLMVNTLKDAEPWVEVWWDSQHGFQVEQRIT